MRVQKCDSSTILWQNHYNLGIHNLCLFLLVDHGLVHMPLPAHVRVNLSLKTILIILCLRYLIFAWNVLIQTFTGIKRTVWYYSVIHIPKTRVVSMLPLNLFQICHQEVSRFEDALATTNNAECHSEQLCTTHCPLSATDHLKWDLVKQYCSTETFGGRMNYLTHQRKKNSCYISHYPLQCTHLDKQSLVEIHQMAPCIR